MTKEHFVEAIHDRLNELLDHISRYDFAIKAVEYEKFRVATNCYLNTIFTMLDDIKERRYDAAGINNKPPTETKSRTSDETSEEQDGIFPGAEPENQGSWACGLANPIARQSERPRAVTVTDIFDPFSAASSAISEVDMAALAEGTITQNVDDLINSIVKSLSWDNVATKNPHIGMGGDVIEFPRGPANN